MADEYVIRVVPSGTDDGTTTHRIGLSRIDDIVTGKTNVRMEQVSIVGHPLQWMQASATASPIATAGDYPNDGDGLTDAADNSGTGSTARITLDASGAPDWDITGWCVAMTGGSAVGEMIRVLSYNTTTKQVTLSDRAWSAVPSAGDPYVIALDVFRRAEVSVKVECEGSTETCTTCLVVFDYPRDPKTSGTDQGKLGLDGVKRAPRRGYLEPLDHYTNYGVTTGATKSGYYHLQVRSSLPRGALLAKVRLVTVPANSKKVVLWLSAV